MMHKRILTAAPTVPLLYACGSMQVRRVGTDTLNPTGLRVQVPVPHEIYTVLQGAKGERVLQYTTMSLATDEEFYDLGFKGGTFNSRELNVSIHPNGTLKEYSFSTKQKVSDTLEGLAEATSAINAARLAVKEAEKPATVADPIAEENEELQLELINLMLKANIEALLNGKQPPFEGLPGGGS